MFDWWKRRKEWPLLDGEELLYTDRSGRFAVTTHRLRAPRILTDTQPPRQTPVGDFKLEDISAIAIETCERPFPCGGLFLMALYAVWLLDVMGTSADRMLILLSASLFGLSIFAAATGVLTYLTRRPARLHIIWDDTEIRWEPPNLYDKEAAILEQALKSAQDARLRSLAAKDEEVMQ